MGCLVTFSALVSLYTPLPIFADGTTVSLLTTQPICALLVLDLFLLFYSLHSHLY